MSEVYVNSDRFIGSLISMKTEGIIWAGQVKRAWHIAAGFSQEKWEDVLTSEQARELVRRLFL